MSPGRRLLIVPVLAVVSSASQADVLLLSKSMHSMKRSCRTRHPNSACLAVALLGFFFSGALVGSGRSYAQCDYEVTVIQPPPCKFFQVRPTFGLGLNDAGDVAGYHWDCSLESWDQAFVWTPDSGLVTLGGPPNTFTSQAHDVNDAGQIVGELDITGDGLGILAFLYNLGEFTTLLPPVPGLISQARSITNSGIVTGTTGDGTPFFKGFVWENGSMELILPTFGPRSLAKDINEINQVVGWMGISNTIDAHAFLWEEGVVTDLGVVPGGYTGQARAINNFGRIAIGGHVQQVDSVVGRSFLWDGGRYSLP